MKITKIQLKQIIKEELGAMTEIETGEDVILRVYRYEDESMGLGDSGTAFFLMVPPEMLNEPGVVVKRGTGSASEGSALGKRLRELGYHHMSHSFEVLDKMPEQPPVYTFDEPAR